MSTSMEMEMEMSMDAEDPRNYLRRNIILKSKLYRTRRSLRIVEELYRWIHKGENPDGDDGRFIFDCCALSIDLENHIVTTYFTPVLRNFRLFFPELDSLVDDPIHYLQIVKKTIAGKEARNVIFSDSLLLDLQQEGLLTAAMVTTVVALRSSLQRCPTVLAIETMRSMLSACNRSFVLHNIRKMVDAFVDGRIRLLAPNLNALVGTAITTKLIGAAGGLSQLSTMPISDIMLLSSAPSNNTRRHPDDEQVITCTPAFEDYPRHEQLPFGITGCYVGQVDIIRSISHQRLQAKASHSLAQAITLAATTDLARTDPTGDNGRAMREEIPRMIDKWKEEDSAVLKKTRAQLTRVRPKNKKLAVSQEYSKTFKLKPKKENIISRSIISRSKTAERVFDSLKGFGLTTATTKDLQAR